MAQHADIMILGMANTPADYLAQVQAEVEGIRVALAKARQQNLCDLRELSQFTLEKMFDEFNDLNQSRRISILHYTGHSQATGLLTVEDGKAKLLHADKLRILLQAQNNLKFVFLNSCFSEAIAEQLVDAGVPVVIGTDSGVKDAAAKRVAVKFYEILGGGSKTIRQAFELTQLYFEHHKDEDDSPFRGFDLGSDYPWRLFYKEETAAGWRLVPESVVDQLERSQGLRKLLIVRDDSEKAGHFSHALRIALSGLNNLMAYDIWQVAEEASPDRRRYAIEEADVIAYLAMPELQGGLEGPLSWAKPLLNPAKSHFIIAGAGHVPSTRQYLQNAGMVAANNPPVILSELMTLEQLKNAIDLDTIFRELFFKKLIELIGVGGDKEQLMSAFGALNFVEQKQAFDFDDHQKKVNFILIEGTPLCGHELLIRRILAYNGLASGGQSKPVHINVKKLVPSGFNELYLWVLLNQNLVGTMSLNPDREAVCRTITQRLQQEDLVVILNEVEEVALPELKQMILNLWKALNDFLPQGDTGNRLFMIFVHTGYRPDHCCVSEVTLQAQNPVCHAVPMPAIQPLAADIFNTWYIDESQHFLPDSPFRKKIQQNKNDILQKKYIKKVVEEICILLECPEVYDEVFKL
ncbi:MAG: CHAT domain-containing protein [Phaeodactylibacter sp.]|nr:CHAT domain-containing protein [Phaeodactylibacter sp.]MCB9052323.1 CHAT domain-containing protein [Lewinellaceae bacterium]